MHNIVRWKVTDDIELLNHFIKLFGGLEVSAERILTETRSFLRLPYSISCDGISEGGYANTEGFSLNLLQKRG